MIRVHTHNFLVIVTITFILDTYSNQKTGRLFLFHFDVITYVDNIILINKCDLNIYNNPYNISTSMCI